MTFKSGVKGREWQMVRATVTMGTAIRWSAQDEVNQKDGDQDEVDGMKKGADSKGNMMHIWKSGWWFVMRKIRMVELGWQQMIDQIV